MAVGIWSHEDIIQNDFAEKALLRSPDKSCTRCHTVLGIKVEFEEFIHIKIINHDFAGPGKTFERFHVEGKSHEHAVAGSCKFLGNHVWNWKHSADVKSVSNNDGFKERKIKPFVHIIGDGMKAQKLSRIEAADISVIGRCGSKHGDHLGIGKSTLKPSKGHVC